MTLSFLSDPEVRRYRDTGDIYRRWRFRRDHEPLGAEGGEWLFQDDDGFHIRSDCRDLDRIRDVDLQWIIELLPMLDDPPLDEIKRASRRAQTLVDELGPALTELGDMAPGLLPPLVDGFHRVTKTLRSRSTASNEHRALWEIQQRHIQAMRLCFEEEPGSAWYVERDVPAVDLRQGDVIVHSWRLDSRPECRVRVRWLTLEEYQVLRDAVFGDRPVGTYRELFTPLTELEREWRARNWCEGLYGFLADRRQWGRRLKVWHSRLAVVRPPGRERVMPVRARSDTGAIFELLAEVGCRLPSGEA